MVLPGDLLARVNERDVVFFLGAGCSMELPAGLPSAGALAEDLVTRGYGVAGDGLEEVAAECGRRGQMVLSEALPKAVWRASPLNVAHRILAQLAKEGLISEVVTTNWDTLIERGMGNAGVPFTPVVNPQLLREGGLAGGVRVAKLHGCIDHTDPPLRATAEELEDWAADWVRVLFEFIARTRTLVFVGYSGAADSVTVTLAAIAEAGEHTERGYIVDPRGPDSVADTDRGRAFLAALGGPGAHYLRMSSEDFFAALRADIFPMLLARPFGVCRGQVERLCQPGGIDADPIVTRVRHVQESWERMGPDWVQSMLPVLLPGFSQPGLADAYVPLIPHAEALAFVWLTYAVLLWSGAGFLDEHGLTHSEEPLVKGLSFLVLVAGLERRDFAGIRAVSQFVESERTSTGVVAIVFGDMGPLPEEHRVNVSVARADAEPSIVRSIGPRCCWVEGSEMLSAFGPDLEADQIQERIVELLRARTTLLEHD